MKIERTKFLMLTGAISAAAVVGATAAGCTIQTTDVNNPPPTPDASPEDEDAGVVVDDDAGDASDAGPACLDDDGDAPDCAPADAAVDCTSTCEYYNGLFKKGVARDIAECMLTFPSCEGNDAVAACVEQASQKACDDATTVDYCAPISCTDPASTSGFSTEQCGTLAKTLNATGRAQLADCVTNAGGPCEEGAEFCLMLGM